MTLADAMREYLYKRSRMIAPHVETIDQVRRQGGGKAQFRVTDRVHPFQAGDTITIRGTGIYDGETTITSVQGTSRFLTPLDFIRNTPTGTAERAGEELDTIFLTEGGCSDPAKSESDMGPLTNEDMEIIKNEKSTYCIITDGDTHDDDSTNDVRLYQQDVNITLYSRPVQLVPDREILDEIREWIDKQITHATQTRDALPTDYRVITYTPDWERDVDGGITRSISGDVTVLVCK